MSTAAALAEAPAAGPGGGPEDDGAMFDLASEIFRTDHATGTKPYFSAGR